MNGLGTVRRSAPERSAGGSRFGRIAKARKRESAKYVEGPFALPLRAPGAGRKGCLWAPGTRRTELTGGPRKNNGSGPTRDPEPHIRVSVPSLLSRFPHFALSRFSQRPPHLHGPPWIAIYSAVARISSSTAATRSGAIHPCSAAWRAAPSVSSTSTILLPSAATSAARSRTCAARIGFAVTSRI